MTYCKAGGSGLWAKSSFHRQLAVKDYIAMYRYLLTLLKALKSKSLVLHNNYVPAMKVKFEDKLDFHFVIRIGRASLRAPDINKSAVISLQATNEGMNNWNIKNQKDILLFHNHMENQRYGATNWHY